MWLRIYLTVSWSMAYCGWLQLEKAVISERLLTSSGTSSQANRLFLAHVYTQPAGSPVGCFVYMQLHRPGNVHVPRATLGRSSMFVSRIRRSVGITAADHFAQPSCLTRKRKSDLSRMMTSSRHRMTRCLSTRRVQARRLLNESLTLHPTRISPAKVRC